MFWVAVFISCKPFLPPPPSPPPPPLLFIQLVSILLWCLFLDNHEIPTEVSTEDIDYMPMPPESSLFIFSTTNMWVEWFCCNKSPDIRHFGSEKGTRTESVPQLFLANFWHRSSARAAQLLAVFYLSQKSLRNSTRPISTSFQRWWILTWSQGTKGNR